MPDSMGDHHVGAQGDSDEQVYNQADDGAVGAYGRYGEAGQVQMINSYSLLQSEPRRMPNYWLVKPAE